MTFPVYFDLGFARLHPHPVMETLAYFIGFRLYLLTRSKDALPGSKAIWIVVAATLGAAAGSKLLYWLEDPAETMRRWNDYGYMMGGKTIVGGLLGGLIAVEWTKKRIGIAQSTGDDMAIPLGVGMCIGRVGCFLAGLDDHTYGTATAWPTGIDFGDGVLRHPTQLYEIAFLLALGAALLVLKQRARSGAVFVPNGGLFQLFMTGYLTFRFAVDFIKPTPHPFAGLNNIQLACIAGLAYYAVRLAKWKAQRDIRKETVPSHAE